MNYELKTKKGRHSERSRGIPLLWDVSTTLDMTNSWWQNVVSTPLNDRASVAERSRSHKKFVIHN
ncbi:MAG: hypothetical protein LBU91_05925 [Bacteroidales bacterium]|jgi:hypothetical protein|nr:hypothetical protein [Bacteroidales bacterium]